MSYNIHWHSFGRVLQVDLSNNLSLEEMHAINQQVIEILDGTDKKVAVLIDVSGLTSSYHTADQLRNTQLYMHHTKIDVLIVIATNKLNRLISLLAFNLARIPFFQFDDAEKAHKHLERRGFMISS